MSEATTFKVGDVVRLKTGDAVRMTVTASPAQQRRHQLGSSIWPPPPEVMIDITGAVSVAWLDRTDCPHERVYPIECLVMYDSPSVWFDGPTPATSGDPRDNW